MSSVSERLGASVEMRAVSRTDRTIDIVASDFSKDSYNTRIDPNGWELEQFRKNPVILLVHNDWSFPVAKALPETIRTEKGELLMRIQFPKKGKYEQADIAFELYADGFMRGVSVGFVPIEWESRSEGEGEDSQNVRVYTRAKLLEVSLVAIPSNDNALAERAHKMNVDAEEVKRRTIEFEEAMEKSQERANDEHARKCIQYFERKQPVNRAASKAMERFFKARGLEQPSDELEAFQRMTELIEEDAETPEVPETPEAPETPGEVPETPEVEQEPTPATPEPPQEVVEEAPQPERKASVQISLHDLTEFPARLAKSYVDAGVEALRRGVPQKGVESLIDGMNTAVADSFTHISNGRNSPEN